MKAVRATMPASVNSLATSPMRRMFSVRSVGEKPRFLLRPWRMLSPSRMKARTSRAQRSFSSATAIVDFPEPESPVSHTVQPRCPFSCSRSARVTAPGCHTMLVAFCLVIGRVLYRPDGDAASAPWDGALPCRLDARSDRCACGDRTIPEGGGMFAGGDMMRLVDSLGEEVDPDSLGCRDPQFIRRYRSEEHTSELQSR